MNKSKKTTIIYVIASVLLFFSMLIGGCYGVYVSVGVNFMRSTVSNVTEISDVGDYYNSAPTNNVSYGGMVNFQASMIGVIILSVVLIVLSIAYLISLFKQLVFFKQFNLIRESGLEHAIEKKIKSKSSVVFMAGFINVLSFLVGAAGIFVNITSNFAGGQIWFLYVVDGLVVLLSLISFIMLIKKVKEKKENRKEVDTNEDDCYKQKKLVKTEIKKNDNSHYDNDVNFDEEFDGIDRIEYILIKLKNMKDSKVISNDEYEYFREKFTGFSNKKLVKKQTRKKIAE